MVSGRWSMDVSYRGCFSICVRSCAGGLYFYYIHCRIDAKALLTQITRLVRNGEVEQARQICAKTKTPLSAILESALWHYQQQNLIRRFRMQLMRLLLRELPRIQRRTHYLSFCKYFHSVRSLTIFGLQEAFGALAAADPSQKLLSLQKVSRSP